MNHSVSPKLLEQIKEIARIVFEDDVGTDPISIEWTGEDEKFSATAMVTKRFFISSTKKLISGISAPTLDGALINLSHAILNRAKQTVSTVKSDYSNLLEEKKNLEQKISRKNNEIVLASATLEEIERKVSEIK